MHGVIARLVGQASARGEDLTQKAFVRAWQALPGFRFDSAVSTWLHRLAVNTALMELRVRRSRPLQHDDENALDAWSTPDTAGHAVLGRDLQRAMAPQRHPSTPRPTIVSGDLRAPGARIQREEFGSGSSFNAR